MNNTIDKSEFSKIERFKKKTRKMPVIHKESILSTVNELKYLLLLKKIPQADMREAMFKGFNSEDLVSIFELSRILARLIKKGNCQELARFLIEVSLNDAEIDFDDFAERTVKDVCEKLLEAMGIYFIEEDNVKENAIRQAILTVSDHITSIETERSEFIEV